MRQAIVTKWFGPTNARGSRIKATADAGSKTVSWDFALSVEQNHERAAAALATKLGWSDYGRYVGGSLPGDKGHVFVLVPRDAESPSMVAQLRLKRVHAALWSDGPDTQHDADTLARVAELVPFRSEGV